MNILVAIIYVILVFLNYQSYVNGKNDRILTYVTSIAALFFLCGANVAFNDEMIGVLDLASYRYVYETKDILTHQDFRFYYLFFYCIKVGQLLGLSFLQWWLVMSLGSLLLIHKACNLHGYNYTLVLACFMSYYEIVFYSGLKFFYGFVFLLIAYGYLLRNTKRDKLKFALFVAIAGGFHVMYYMFLIFLIKPNKNQERFIRTIVVLTIILTIINRISGTAVSFMKPFFDSFDSDHINVYVTEGSNYGFYIAVILELLMIFIPYKVRQYTTNDEVGATYIDSFYYSVLLTLIFCPFYAVSLAFVRIITCFSLVAIAAASSILEYSPESRRLGLQLSLMMVFSYLFKNLILDAYYGDWAFFKQSILPYFDVI